HHFGAVARNAFQVSLGVTPGRRWAVVSINLASSGPGCGARSSGHVFGAGFSGRQNTPLEMRGRLGPSRLEMAMPVRDASKIGQTHSRNLVLSGDIIGWDPGGVTHELIPSARAIATSANRSPPLAASPCSYPPSRPPR